MSIEDELVEAEREGWTALSGGRGGSSRFEMKDPRVVVLMPDSGVVVYSIVARREGQEPCSAVVSSTFASGSSRCAGRLRPRGSAAASVSSNPLLGRIIRHAPGRQGYEPISIAWLAWKTPSGSTARRMARRRS